MTKYTIVPFYRSITQTHLTAQGIPTTEQREYLGGLYGYVPLMDYDSESRDPMNLGIIYIGRKANQVTELALDIRDKLWFRKKGNTVEVAPAVFPRLQSIEESLTRTGAIGTLRNLNDRERTAFLERLFPN